MFFSNSLIFPNNLNFPANLITIIKDDAKLLLWVKLISISSLSTPSSKLYLKFFDPVSPNRHECYLPTTSLPACPHLPRSDPCASPFFSACKSDALCYLFLGWEHFKGNHAVVQTVRIIFCWYQGILQLSFLRTSNFMFWFPLKSVRLMRAPFTFRNLFFLPHSFPFQRFHCPLIFPYYFSLNVSLYPVSDSANSNNDEPSLNVLCAFFPRLTAIFQSRTATFSHSDETYNCGEVFQIFAIF